MNDKPPYVIRVHATWVSARRFERRVGIPILTQLKLDPRAGPCVGCLGYSGERRGGGGGRAIGFAAREDGINQSGSRAA